MRKTLIIVAVVIGVLLASAVGGVLYVAKEAEAQFDAALERFSSPPTVVLKKVSWQGKLLGAEAESSLEISVGPQKIAIPFKHVISYAPFASGLAEVHTEMVVPPPFKPVVDSVLKGATPLAGDTVIGFDGSQTTQFESPAFSVKDANGTANWQGIKGTITVQDAHVVLSATAPGLKAQSPLGNLTVQGIAVKGDVTKSSDDIWLGTNAIEMARLEAVPPLMPAVAVEGFKLSGSLAEQGAGLVRYGIGVDLKRVAAPEMVFTNIGYEVEFSNLDRALLVKWSKAMEKFRPGGADAGAAAAGMLMNDMATFLKRSPKATLKRCTAVTPWGDFKATATASFDGKGELPPQPMAWTSRVGVEGKLDISASLLTWVLQQQVKERANLIANAGKKPQPEQAQMLTEKLAQVRLTRLEQTGTVMRSGDRYLLELKMSNGSPTVNGKDLKEIQSLIE